MQQINHFSHRHPLQPLEVHAADAAVCSGCDHDIRCSAYACTKPTCPFLLHMTCLDLPRRIRHPGHPKHSLILHSSPPYADKEFTCDACRSSGHGFTYHCQACSFDLHVECAASPEIEDRPADHEHPLFLLLGVVEKGFPCYACGDLVGKGCWRYACVGCGFGCHLKCTANTDQEGEG